ncbi:NAD(P)/FAD-dependent oxidoreductase [Thiofilum flexile]|uniref:NAD(P)/FAD-dependent oxidoreductase n=1 Tax=Thiofilum flexile TaxID=125627 RepID=UPI0003734B94|nr:FAD-binding oxidoreductase [Thiofilum flexile]
MEHPLSNPAERAASYYQASSNPFQHRPPLQEQLQADVAIIGGGISGCSAALHLAQRGYKVVQIEARQFGFGASGRSGGQLIFGLACSNDTIKQQLGKEAAQAIFAMSLEALDLTRQLIQAHQIQCDLQSGVAIAALKNRHVRDLKAYQQELTEEYGYDHLQWIEGVELPSYIQSKRYQALLLDSRSGHLHPLNYTLGLADAAQRHGVLQFENTPALSITPHSKIKIATPEGAITADSVLLGTNAYIEHLGEPLQSYIMPVGTYILATEPLDSELAQSLLPQHNAIFDSQFVVDYFRLSADNRLLFGGGVSYSRLPPRDLAATMRQRMLTVFPQLAKVKTEFCWGGYVAITQNRAPHFGRLAPNIYFTQGYSGHGMALTGLAGKLVAEAISGQAERFDLFANIKHRRFWGGKYLKTPALVAAMGWYRMRDWL